MYFFSSEDERRLNQLQKNKLLLADRLIEDIDKLLKDKSKHNLTSIKSAVFDIVVLERVLARIGFECELKGNLKSIRNSLAHIDERMEKFNFRPIKVGEFKTNRKEAGNRFKNSISLNFQGAVVDAKVGIQIDGTVSTVEATSLYGMVDDKFLWVDKTGNQKFTDIATITKEYKELLKTLR